LCIQPFRGKQSSVKDNEIFARINELVDEEHQLRDKLRTGDVSAEDEHERVRELEVTLDRCWDLLRQRRALREAHADPEQAKARPATEVEGYQQ
jgi:hypothetical protein